MVRGCDGAAEAADAGLRNGFDAAPELPGADVPAALAGADAVEAAGVSNPERIPSVTLSPGFAGLALAAAFASAGAAELAGVWAGGGAG